jgi:predicted lipid-binding transport protein (Tim44 family)
MDILFLIFLSAFLLYRLWSILGTRNGFEKQRPFMESDEDKVIIMPKKHINEEFANEEEFVSEYQLRRLSKIFEVLPEFDALSFLENSKNAFQMITKAFVEGNKKRLKYLVSSDVFDVFEGVIDDRNAQNITQETEIVDFLNVEIDHSNVISVENEIEMAQIGVLFKTKQICVTYNEKGEIIDNPAKISITQQDVWTFEKRVGDENPTWLLVKTKTLS